MKEHKKNTSATQRRDSKQTDLEAKSKKQAYVDVSKKTASAISRVK